MNGATSLFLSLFNVSTRNPSRRGSITSEPQQSRPRGHMTEFIITRLRSLQAYEKSTNLKASSKAVHAKAHYQGKNKGTSERTVSCSICKSNHITAHCPQYTSKPVQQRLELITKHRLCYNCLGPHRSSVCRITKRCQKCAKKHHTSIHPGNARIATTETATATASTPQPSTSTAPAAAVLHSSAVTPTVSSCILLATAQVVIITQDGRRSTARALIDQESEVSLISERLVQRMRIPRQHSSVALIGIGANFSNRSKGLASFTVSSHLNSDFKCIVSAHILSKLTSSIPSIPLKTPGWAHLHGLTLADQQYGTPGSIDLILGADVYGQIIEDGVVKGDADSPIGQLTKFGWIISGPTQAASSNVTRRSYHTPSTKHFTI